MERIEAAVHEMAPAPAEGRGRSTVRLGELLVREGLLDPSQLEHALAAQRERGGRLGDVLVALGLVDERELARVLGEQLGVDVVDLRSAQLDPQVLALLPEDVARELHAIPIAVEGERVVVAVSDPLDETLTDRCITALERPVRLVIAARSDIDRAIGIVYRSTARIDDALRDFEARIEEQRAALAPEPDDRIVVDENAPVVQVVNMLLEQAVRDRASDVHIEPQPDRVRVRVRTDGALHEVLTLPQSVGPSLVSRIKVMADMNIVERRRPQDGQMAVTVGGRDLDVRVSTTGTMFGEKCVLRLLDRSRALLRLDELGMPDDVAQRYSQLVRSPHGMVVCAGPTGSGKTTTLYATMMEIATDEVNVTTIEDPVEYVFPSINQIQVNEQADITFASTLRSILRQDPDAILVGEIRDVETARIAVQAALTGHFVMTSLHATDAVAALHRFLDMGVEPFLVASSLLGVVGQRLVRKVCPHCVEPYVPDEEERKYYVLGGGDIDTVRLVRGAGCNFCGHTGYFDRIGVYEVLTMTSTIKRLVAQDAPYEVVKEAAIAEGMRTLQQEAMRLVTEQVTTVAEVARTVQTG
ncbi:MAG: pilus assembly protein PilB [Acidimicrobiia bacterium]|nr:MAG: pilus assembly protein PilB [Acidimicrobiia bacterium]